MSQERSTFSQSNTVKHKKFHLLIVRISHTYLISHLALRVKDRCKPEMARHINGSRLQRHHDRSATNRRNVYFSLEYAIVHDYSANGAGIYCRLIINYVDYSIIVINLFRIIVFILIIPYNFSNLTFMLNNNAIWFI